MGEAGFHVEALSLSSVRSCWIIWGQNSSINQIDIFNSNDPADINYLRLLDTNEKTL